MKEEIQYDVIILGGGLAGLTLSIQLKKSNPEISILVLERRATEAPAAAHKVGESTVELGTHYLREILDLKSYLDKKQLPKYGLRFYLTPQHKEDLTKRVEIGPRVKLPVPSHQLDRGIFENELCRITSDLGCKLILGASVKEVNFSDDFHEVLYSKSGEKFSAKGKWVVDATGRAGVLKRKLGFQRPLDHDVNAVWFRYNCVIDVDDWSADPVWSGQLKPGLRKLGTIHFMDHGYWVWIIPLTEGSTSIGIVADQKLHPFDSLNTYEKAIQWLEKNEPQCAEKFKEKKDDLLDFMILRHYAHHSGKFYSGERWGVTGESGAFLDPFYSPGTDFISLSNCWLHDLITRYLSGEDVSVRSIIYERVHTALIDNWLPIYQNKYPLMGNTQIMVCKIFWDFATYWSIQVPIFVNNGFTNIRLLTRLSSESESIFQRLGKLNNQVQNLFVAWSPYEKETFTHKYFDPLEIDFLKNFQQNIGKKTATPEELLARLESNMNVLEKIASELFRRVNTVVNNQPYDLVVNPYQMDLSVGPGDGPENLFGTDTLISEDIDKFWMYSFSKDPVITA